MRTITQKDKKGLEAAFRVFARELSGQRITADTCETLVARALAEGITIDELLNRGNWARALAGVPELSPEEYVDALCDSSIDVLELKDEPGWHDPQFGWRIVAEAAHDFYMSVTGKGGRWNIPSSLMNLAKAVSAHSLQSILSEDLIFAVTSVDEPATYFDYIQAIAKDFNSLPVDATLTAEQEARRCRAAETLNIQEPEEGAEGEYAGGEVPGDTPEDEPFPEYTELGDGSTVLTPNPTDYKRSSIQSFITGCSMAEIAGLARTMEDGETLSLSDFVENLTHGRFDRNLETPEIRKVHMRLNADLFDSFLEAYKMQGFDADDESKRKELETYDILHDSWDFRTPQVRKLHKLKSLIFQYGADDDDLVDAITDLQNLYGE